MMKRIFFILVVLLLPYQHVFAAEPTAAQLLAAAILNADGDPSTNVSDPSTLTATQTANTIKNAPAASVTAAVESVINSRTYEFLAASLANAATSNPGVSANSATAAANNALARNYGSDAPVLTTASVTNANPTLTQSEASTSLNAVYRAASGNRQARLTTAYNSTSGGSPLTPAEFIAAVEEENS